MYAFALRNTTVNHIRGCVVKILYPTLPRFQSKMAIVWDRSINGNASSPPAKHGNEHGGVKTASVMAGQSAKMVPVLRGEISNTQSRPLNGHPPSWLLRLDYHLLRSCFSVYSGKRAPN